MSWTKTRKVIMPTRPLALKLAALILCGAVSVGLLSCPSTNTPVVRILLSWDYEGPMPAAFQIDRSLDRGRTWTVYHEGIAPTARTFTDPAPAGAFPCYRVSAIATPPARSSPPSHFACLAGPGATAPSPLGGRHGSR